jgi:hypothetical protein
MKPWGGVAACLPAEGRSDSLVRRTADDLECKVVTCRIRKAKKAHLRKAGEAVGKA